MTDGTLPLISSGPHIRNRKSVNRVMWMVAISLLPAGAWAVYAFGTGVLPVIGVSVAAAILTEWIINLAQRRPLTIGDGSALVTGLLVAYNMPAAVPGSLPLYVPLLASVVAIAVVKHAFGGLGQNWMNPALAGRIFVFFAWLPAMTSGWATAMRPDVVSAATPLKALKFGGASIPACQDLFLGKVSGCLGEVSAAALLLGALFLILIKVLDWEIPLVYLGSAALFSWIFGGLAVAGAPPQWFAGDPLYHILSGGIMLGALYMATDWVTSPITFKGRLLFALGCGILTVLIRLTGKNVEGVSFAIVLMNITVPLIDRMFRPKRFGLQTSGGQA